MCLEGPPQSPLERGPKKDRTCPTRHGDRMNTQAILDCAGQVQHAVIPGSHKMVFARLRDKWDWSIEHEHEHEHDLLAGWGACRSCNCSGYDGKHDRCKCGHHFSQHR